MFTGIIEATGTMGALEGGRLSVRTPLAAELRESDSIAVNGVCLTVLAPGASRPRFVRFSVSGERSQ